MIAERRIAEKFLNAFHWIAHPERDGLHLGLVICVQKVASHRNQDLLELRAGWQGIDLLDKLVLVPI